MNRPDEIDPANVGLAYVVIGFILTFSVGLAVDGLAGERAAQIAAGTLAGSLILGMGAFLAWWWWPAISSARQPDDTPGWAREDA